MMSMQLAIVLRVTKCEMGLGAGRPRRIYPRRSGVGLASGSCKTIACLLRALFLSSSSALLYSTLPSPHLRDDSDRNTGPKRWNRHHAAGEEGT